MWTSLCWLSPSPQACGAARCSAALRQQLLLGGVALSSTSDRLRRTQKHVMTSMLLVFLTLSNASTCIVSHETRTTTDRSQPRKVRIALVGGGISGASTATFLSLLQRQVNNEIECRQQQQEKPVKTQLDTKASTGHKAYVPLKAESERLATPFPTPSNARHFRVPIQFEVDLYEASHRMGGRLDYGTVAGRIVELGGVDVHSANFWMTTFHDLLNEFSKNLGGNGWSTPGDKAGSIDTNEQLPFITRIQQDEPLHQGRLASEQLHTETSTVQTQQQQQYVDSSTPYSALTPKPPSGKGVKAQEQQKQHYEQTSTGAPRKGGIPNVDTERKTVYLRGADSEQRITDTGNALQWKGQGVSNNVDQGAEDETPSETAVSKKAGLEKNKGSDSKKRKVYDAAQGEKFILDDSSEVEHELEDVKQVGLPDLQTVSRDAYEKGWKNSFAFPCPLTEFHAALGGSTVMLHGGNKVTPIASVTLALIKCGITALADSVKQIVDKWQAVYDGSFGGPSCSKRVALALSPATELEWFRRFNTSEAEFPPCSITAQARSAATTGVEMIDNLGLSDEIRQPFSSFIRFHKIERVGVDLVDAFVRSVFSQSASQVHTLAGAFALSGFFGAPYDRKIYSGRVVVELLIARYADNAYMNCPIATVEELALEDGEEDDDWEEEEVENVGGARIIANEGRGEQSAEHNGDAHRARVKARRTDLVSGVVEEIETPTNNREEKGAVREKHDAVLAEEGGGQENAGSGKQLPEQDAGGYADRVRSKSKKKRRRKKRFKVVPAEARYCKNEKARKKLDETLYDFVVICTPLEGTTLNILRRVHDGPEAGKSSFSHVGTKAAHRENDGIKRRKKRKAIEERRDEVQERERCRRSGTASDGSTWVTVNEKSAMEEANVAKSNIEDEINLQAINFPDEKMGKMNAMLDSIVSRKKGGKSETNAGEASEANKNQTPPKYEKARADGTEEEEEDGAAEECRTGNEQKKLCPATHLEAIDVPERPFVATQITCVASDGMVYYPMGERKLKNERKRRRRGGVQRFPPRTLFTSESLFSQYFPFGDVFLATCQDVVELNSKRPVIYGLDDESVDGDYQSENLSRESKVTRIGSGTVFATTSMPSTTHDRGGSNREVSDATKMLQVLEAAHTDDKDNDSLEQTDLPKLTVAGPRVGSSRNTVDNPKSVFSPMSANHFFTRLRKGKYSSNQPAKTICCAVTAEEPDEAEISDLFSNVQQIESRSWCLAHPVMHPFAGTKRFPAQAKFTSGKEHQPDAAAAKSLPDEYADESGEDDEENERERTAKTVDINFTNFVLMEDVFYPGAFENVFSCTEGLVISAKNTVNLILRSMLEHYGVDI